MLNTLFHYPRVLARHCQGPSAQAREQYLTHRADQGAALDTLLRTVRELLVIAQRLDLTIDRMISIQQVEAAAGRWVHHQQRRGRACGQKGSRQWFIQTALSWLRFLGRLEAHDKEPLPFADLVEHFAAACMRDQRGLSEVTIRHRCWHAQKQCPLWSATVRSLSALIAGRSPSDDVFLNRCSRPLTRFGIHTLVERYVDKLQGTMPSLATKRVSPHTIRHTTATHLLRAGVDINTIRAWAWARLA